MTDLASIIVRDGGAYEDVDFNPPATWAKAVDAVVRGFDPHTVAMVLADGTDEDEWQMFCDANRPQADDFPSRFAIPVTSAQARLSIALAVECDDDLWLPPFQARTIAALVEGPRIDARLIEAAEHWLAEGEDLPPVTEREERLRAAIEARKLFQQHIRGGGS